MTTLRAAVVYDCLFPINTGGGERVYRAVAENLVERGATVDYVTRRQWAGPPPPAPFAVVGVSTGDVYDSTGTRTSLGALRFAWGVFRYFLARRGEYHIIIASALPVLTLLAARLATIGSRTRVVADWLEVWTWHKWREYSGTALGTLAYLLQSIGIFSTRNHSADSSFTARRVTAIRRSITPVVMGLVDLAGAARVRRPPDDPAYVVFVGRLIADKRVTTLPAAISLARHTLPDLRLVVIGVGPVAAELEADVRAHAQEDSITLVGRVDEDALERYVGSAAVLVNPSAREGFGLVVAEAAAHGVPSVVVAGDDNAAVELIDEGRNGFIAQDIDPRSLSEAILRAIAAGDALRDSTYAWFLEARVDKGIASSVAAVLESVGFASD